MKTITVETSQLSGPALDWAVAKAIGHEVRVNMSIPYRHTEPEGPPFIEAYEEESWLGTDAGHMPWSPSTYWSQGGPLIEKYIGLMMVDEENAEPRYAESACSNLFGYANGRTYLIAICRAIVAAELGDDVEVPAEIVEVGE